MVVMAVTDAEPLHRAAPLWVKVLLAAGFAVAGWVVASLLGGLTASADDTPQADPHPAKEHAHAPAPGGGLLGGLVGGTVNTLVGTVDQVTTTVTGTLSTTVTGTVGTLTGTVGNLTSTVGNLTNTVTATTDAVIQPVTSTLIAPTPSVAKQQQTTKAQTRIETVPQSAAPAVAPTPPPAPAPALPATVTAQQPLKHKQTTSPAVAPKTQQPVSDQLVQAKKGQPAPSPNDPGGQFCNAVAAHDGGGNTKHALAILGARSGIAQLASIGVPRQVTQVDNSRDAALPTTSPD